MVSIFYNGNTDIGNIEIVSKCNPGIGGSEYLLLLLFYYLNLLCPHLKCQLLTTDKSIKGNNITYVSDELEAIRKSKDIGANEFIFIPKKDNIDFYNLLSKEQINGIAWVHNYISYEILELLEKNKEIKRIVFVGKEQYDSYIDSEIINKSCYIYNMIPKVKHEPVEPSKKGNVVTYVGSIIPAKGFHMLASIWRDVLKEIPDAKLQVIGNGKLYNKDSKLGKYNIADDKYEKKFIKYLIDKRGNVIDSVKFLGTIGKEKEKYINETKVGVANPTGISETFCLSAVEYKTYGIPVVTYNGYGLLDTVRNGVDGILIKNKRQLKNAIIKLLKNDELNKKMGKNAYIDGFQCFWPENIIPTWEKVINEVNLGLNPNIDFPNKNYFNDFKWIKIINYKLKSIFNLKIKGLSYRISKIKMYIKRIMHF